jgi:hypothetical protein
MVPAEALSRLSRAAVHGPGTPIRFESKANQVNRLDFDLLDSPLR